MRGMRGFRGLRQNRAPRATINEAITADPVRLVGSSGKQLGVVPLAEARAGAEAEGLDLVLIAPEAEPPVCKVMDHGKHVFELKKQRAASKKRQRRVHIKEIKFRPGTEEGDYQVKLRNLIRFLSDGDKTKVSLRFRGREMAHQHIGRELIERIRQDLSDYGSVEQEPRMEGRQIVMLLTPSKKLKDHRKPKDLKPEKQKTKETKS